MGTCSLLNIDTVMWGIKIRNKTEMFCRVWQTNVFEWFSASMMPLSDFFHNSCLIRRIQQKNLKNNLET